ncbi:probable flavin-containing monoamine oxidase C [Coccinella septempunctata]|uniref:probable flavin-containing monoamine oxidase C n=1 Tax=Coccinella septempunctata TaxID=41139 RepID=UPI001D0721EE|nr:probable flavin-containing monoamine oxidase C [Coccinella septempunctata]
MYLNYRELDADIIIIGADIAGLSAAYLLLEKDPHIDFLIIDVDDKLDFSKKQYSSLWNLKWANNTKNKKKTKFADDPLQLDYQFVFSKQTNLVNLLHKLDIQIIEKDKMLGKILIDYDKVYEVSTKENILDLLNFHERTILSSFCKQINYLAMTFSFGKRNTLSDFDDISMNILLNRLISSKKVRDLITQTFLYNSGLQPKDVSASFFLAYCNSTQGIQTQFIWNEKGFHQFYIGGGVKNIRSKMIDVIGEESILKVSEITEISWDDFSAGIRTPHDYFFANKIVFTLNENETKNITFVPPLSDEKQIIANNLIKGKLKKFIVNYTKPFWVNKGLSGDAYVFNTDGRNGPLHVCLNVSKVTDNNYTLAGLTEEDSDKTEILNQLVMYFGDEAANPESYFENSSSFHELGFPYGCKSMKYFENIQRTTERIVWASPETTTNWYGTAAGSIEAGYKGAIRALQEAKPNTLTLDDLNIVSPNEVYIPPRATGFFGIQWHIFIPTLLLIVYGVVKVRRYFAKKLLK